jgi:hypothetical protein
MVSDIVNSPLLILILALLSLKVTISFLIGEETLFISLTRMNLILKPALALVIDIDVYRIELIGEVDHILGSQ